MGKHIFLCPCFSLQVKWWAWEHRCLGESELKFRVPLSFTLSPILSVSPTPHFEWWDQGLEEAYLLCSAFPILLCLPFCLLFWNKIRGGDLDSQVTVIELLHLVVWHCLFLLLSFVSGKVFCGLEEIKRKFISLEYCWESVLCTSYDCFL